MPISVNKAQIMDEVWEIRCEERKEQNCRAGVEENKAMERKNNSGKGTLETFGTITYGPIFYQTFKGVPFLIYVGAFLIKFPHKFRQLVN